VVFLWNELRMLGLLSRSDPHNVMSSRFLSRVPTSLWISSLCVAGSGCRPSEAYVPFDVSGLNDLPTNIANDLVGDCAVIGVLGGRDARPGGA
jgi:hypothetical protein